MPMKASSPGTYDKSYQAIHSASGEWTDGRLEHVMVETTSRH